MARTHSGMERVVDGLAARLEAAGTPERALHEKAYLRSDREHYGTAVPVIRKLTLQTLRTEPSLADSDAREPLLELVTLAWERGPHELRMAAVEALCARAGALVEQDIDFVERLLREARTWALVDGIAPAVAWNLVSRYPSLDARIDAWACDPDFWLRRSALLTYLIPMRKAAPVFERFTELADSLLEDSEFFVRKAIGWVLRERTKDAADEVYAWLLPRASRTSGLTVREASKNMSEARRAALSAARTKPTG